MVFLKSGWAKYISGPRLTLVLAIGEGKNVWVLFDDGESYDFWFEQKWLRNDGDPFL